MSSAPQPAGTFPQFMQKDLDLLQPPASGNYKSYTQYIKDFEVYQKFRRDIMRALSAKAKRVKAPALKPVVVHKGKQFVPVLFDGTKLPARQALQNLRFGDLKPQIPTIQSVYELPTKEQTAQKKAALKKRQKKADYKKRLQLKKKLALDLQLMRLEERKLPHRPVDRSGFHRADPTTGLQVQAMNVRSDAREGILPGSRIFDPKGIDLARSNAISGRPGPSKFPLPLEPETPRDRQGMPISPDRTKISDDEWRVLLTDSGEAARVRRAEIRKAAGQKKYIPPTRK